MNRESSERNAFRPGPLDSKNVDVPATPDFEASPLLPVVTQDATTGEVLMVAYMDREAWDRTRETGYAHYHSRSRNALWKKGETSGHVQRVTEIRVDCDLDAILLLVDQTGPACHTGNRSCFYRSVRPLPE